MTTHRDIESALRDDLDRIGGAVRPDDGLADRLIANATSGTRTVVALRPARRFVAPLLAAAVCVVLAVGIVVANRFSADRQGPAVAPAVTTDLTTAAPTTATPTTAALSSSLPSDAFMTAGPPPPPNPAGYDWLRVLPAASGAPKGFSGTYTRFLDADNGFVLGEAPCTQNVNDCVALIRTDDGGTTWTPLAVPPKLRALSIDDGCGVPAVQSMLGCLDDITFDDADHGYLFGSERAYATSDGGRSWQLVPSPAPSHGYTFVGNRVLRLVQHSRDTGYPYQLQSAPTGSTDFRPITDDQFSDSTGFGIYQGGPVTYLTAGTSVQKLTKRIFRTTDARVWEPVALPCDGKLDYVPLFPAQDGSVFAECGDLDTSEVYRMTADGTTWTRIPSPQFDGASGGVIVSATSADQLARLVGIEGEGDLRSWVSTDDGGKTWSEPRKVEVAFRTADLEPRLSSAAGAVSFVAGEGRDLASSFDGGKTWQQRAFG